MTILIGKELWKGGCFKWKRWSRSGSCLVLEGEERDTQEWSVVGDGSLFQVSETNHILYGIITLSPQFACHLPFKQEEVTLIGMPPEL
jgi:hypothetical protein